MKQKHLVIVAVACGLVAALCIVFFMISVQNEANAARAEALARYGGEQVDICVATRDIAAGERVDLSAIETRPWIADLLPEGAVREASTISGRTTTSSILKGEVISELRFESSYSDFEIPAGMEAVSVPAKSVQAVGGAIRPGMSVDVYATGDSSTTALMTDVLVLATTVGSAGSFSSGDSGCITLAVAPDGVEEIIAASSRTELYFVLPGAGSGDKVGKKTAKGSADEGSADEGAFGSSQEADASAEAEAGKSSKGSDAETRDSDDGEDAASEDAQEG